MRCGTKRFTIDYERQGTTQTMEVQARTAAEARKQIRMTCGGKVIRIKRNDRYKQICPFLLVEHTTT